MPSLTGILETALYVADLDRGERFYTDVLALPCIHTDPRMRGFDVAGHGVLLLFETGASLHPIETPGGTIPAHDGAGPVHVAFSILRDELDAWIERLEAAGVAIEGRTEWPRGGTSIYFRDPDSHLLELATPGLWQGY